MLDWLIITLPQEFQNCSTSVGLVHFLIIWPVEVTNLTLTLKCDLWE